MSINSSLSFNKGEKETESQKVEKVKVTKISTPKPNNQTPPPSSSLSLTLLTSLHELRRRLELAESGLTSHLHIPLGDNSVYECSVHIQKLQVIYSYKV